MGGQDLDPLVSKHDMAQYTRALLLQLMRRLLTCPLIGEDFAFPGDFDLRPWTDPTSELPSKA